MTKTNWALALTALLTTIVVSLFGKGLSALVGVLLNLIIP